MIGERIVPKSNGDEQNPLPPDIEQGLDRLEAQAGTETPAPGVVPEQVLVESWHDAVEWAFNLAKELTPGWNWTPTASRMFVSGGTDLMNRYFPGGPGAWETWGPWAKLLAALGVFGGANVANLKAMHKRLKDGRKANSGNGANAKRKDTEHEAGSESGTPAAGIRSEGEVGRA